MIIWKFLPKVLESHQFPEKSEGGPGPNQQMTGNQRQGNPCEVAGGGAVMPKLCRPILVKLLLLLLKAIASEPIVKMPKVIIEDPTARMHKAFVEPPGEAHHGDRWRALNKRGHNLRARMERM